MNRRDFAKGLAALALAGGLKSLAKICNSTCQSNDNSLWVVLDGPFAIVLNSTTHAIKAFSPKHSGEHMLAFNTVVCDNTQNYKFQMAIPNWSSSPPPLCVQNDFPQFCAENTKFDGTTGDSLLTIDLPAPQRIIAYDSGYKADMQGSTKGVRVPSIHVMQYDLNGNVPTMTASYGSTSISLPAMDGFFWFEVGLPKLLGGGDSDPSGSHAKDFYNNSILAHFQDLAGDNNRKIDQIYKTASLPPQHGVPAHPPKTPPSRPSEPNLPAHIAKLKASRKRIFTTTTFECKAGGLLATSA